MKNKVQIIFIAVSCLALFAGMFAYLKLFSAQTEIKELKTWRDETGIPNLMIQETMIYLFANSAGVNPQDLRNTAINTIKEKIKESKK